MKTAVARDERNAKVKGRCGHDTVRHVGDRVSRHAPQSAGHMSIERNNLACGILVVQRQKCKLAYRWLLRCQFSESTDDGNLAEITNAGKGAECRGYQEKSRGKLPHISRRGCAIFSSYKTIKPFNGLQKERSPGCGPGFVWFRGPNISAG